MNSLAWLIFVILSFVAALMIVVYQGSGTDYPPSPRQNNCEQFNTIGSNDIRNTTLRSKYDCFKDKYKKILLVIIYNHPLYDSVQLLNQFYRKIFPNMFICGSLKNSTHQVHGLFIYKGVFGYQCLAEAIRKNPGFDGYLYVNDDVIVNYWNWERFGFDPNKIGESSNAFGRADLSSHIPDDWYWWISPFGFNNCKNAVDEIKTMAKISRTYSTSWETFKKNGHGKLYCNNGRSDILFIPGHLALGFQEISNVFYRNHVFLEIAIPTIIRFLSDSKDIQTLPGMYLPGDVRKNDSSVVDSRYFWVTYLAKPLLWFIHPFKLHHYHDHNRDLNVALFKEILVKKTEHLVNC